MDCTPPVQWEPGSVHGISQAKILEWVAISFSKGSSWPRNWTHVSCIGRQILYHWASREALTASARRLITTKRSFSDENSVSFIKRKKSGRYEINLFICYWNVTVNTYSIFAIYTISYIYTIYITILQLALIYIDHFPNASSNWNLETQRKINHSFIWGAHNVIS